MENPKGQPPTSASSAFSLLIKLGKQSCGDEEGKDWEGGHVLASFVGCPGAFHPGINR